MLEMDAGVLGWQGAFGGHESFHDLSAASFAMMMMFLWHDAGDQLHQLQWQMNCSVEWNWGGGGGGGGGKE